MTPFDLLKSRLQADMVQGNMHACLRDNGRLAGGYAAAGELSVMDLHYLGELAESLSINHTEGRSKWDAAVVYGRNQPVRWEVSTVRDEELDWTSSIRGGTESVEHRIIDPAWVQDEDIEEPADWHPCSELNRYLNALFESEDHVGYVTESWWNDEAKRHLPKRGAYDRTAGQLIAQLGRAGASIGRVMGDPEPGVGAWIRFNALDGAGVKDSNVTRFRFALVECDDIPISRQYALIKELELPIATLVHSGGKSLHATVRVDADNYEEYRKRVDFLYDVCKRNGLSMDRQNRNPSRLSRMPGVMRGERKQWLVATHIGKASWEEWKEWIEDLNDDLPDIEEVHVDNKEPELAPSLIDGVLREGHKLLISGPSKAGKSFALIQLAIAMAQGGEWMGWKVAQGRCLYVNLELDARSSKHRFWKIYQTLGEAPEKGMIDVWNLRGNATALDKLTPKLIRRAEKRGYKAVIIDPIYKVLTGDENSASEMAAFCNQFDRICLALGAATIYCHHHSKGAQGQKSSRDRSSGSGVFARDPDAIIDLIELVIDSARRKQIANRWESEAICGVLSEVMPGWEADVGQDDMSISHVMAAWAKDHGHDSAAYIARMAARASAEGASGWRVETTLREFANSPARNVFFRYPVHIVDRHDLLKDAKAEGEEPPWAKMQEDRKRRNEATKEEANASFQTALEASRGPDGLTKVSDVAEYLGISEKSVRNRVKKFPGLVVDSGLIRPNGDK